MSGIFIGKCGHVVTRQAVSSHLSADSHVTDGYLSNSRQLQTMALCLGSQMLNSISVATVLTVTINDIYYTENIQYLNKFHFIFIRIIYS